MAASSCRGLSECAPTPGDRHPLTKRSLAGLLTRIPVEYLYGLSRIELRAWQRPAVGEPFARYRIRTRDILLFSLPPVRYCKPLDPYFRASYEKFDAVIDQEGEGFRISWRSPAALSLWFYCEIFTHELGHHFVEQYRAKNGRIASVGTRNSWPIYAPDDSRANREEPVQATDFVHLYRVKSRSIQGWVALWQKPQRIACRGLSKG